MADNNNDTKGGARKLWRFNLNKDGTVDFANRKLLHDWETGRGPDGIKQDVKGRLYVAAGLNKPNPPFEPATDKKGGIYVFTSEGKLLTFLPVPTDEVTNCAFGGDDLRTLYITGGGVLYSIPTVTPGRVVWPKSGLSMPSSADELVDIIDDAGHTIDVVTRREMRARHLPHRSTAILVFNAARRPLHSLADPY